jgi:alanine dehydrogenase
MWETMVPIRLLTRPDVEQVLTMDETIAVMEDAFRAHGEGKVVQPSPVRIHVGKHEGRLTARAAYIEPMDAVGLKFTGGYYANPRKFGLPSILGVIILVDAKSGAPLAVMDASFITGIRTGALGAVAARYLARNDASVVGIIGAGTQGRFQLRGLHAIFDLEEVRVADMSKRILTSYVNDMRGELGVTVRAVESGQDAAAGADIIVTCTPSLTPVLRADWVDAGSHINTIGGKHELDPQIMKLADKIVVDEWAQTKGTQDFQTALAAGVISEDDIHGEIGEVVLGAKAGRTSRSEVTLFVTSGLAVEDVAAAARAYERAQARGIGTELTL